MAGESYGCGGVFVERIETPTTKIVKVAVVVCIHPIGATRRDLGVSVGHYIAIVHPNCFQCWFQRPKPKPLLLMMMMLMFLKG